MRYSAKLSDAAHVLALIALNPQDANLSSASIAESVQTNPAYVRQIMMRLRQAGLMESVTGRARPTLARPAEEISLLNIYRAMEGDKPLLHLDTHTNPECGVGVNIQLALKDCYEDVQRAAEGRMRAISLADVLGLYRQKVAESA